MIGLDSAPLWIIRKLYKKYNMKGFEYLIKNGTLKELESTMPPVTAAAWPSIYTGKKPSEHGIMDFLYIDRNYTRQLIYYESEKHTPFWEELADRGLRSLVVTPPMVLQKSKSKNVDMVTGWPLQPSYNSTELERAARKYGFKGEPDIAVELDKRSITLDEASHQYTKSMRTRAEMSKYLIKKNDYDCVFVCFTEADRIQHYALNNKSWEKYLAPLYKETSDFLEWVIEYSREKKEEAMIILISDHGAQPVRSKFLANSWLINEGFAALKEQKAQQGKKGILYGAKKYASERIMKLSFRRAVYNRMPAFMKKAVEKMIEESTDVADENQKIQENDLDMGKTRAFAAVSYGPVGMIWINDERFSHPAVKRQEAPKVTRELAIKLKRLRTNDGKPLVVDLINGKEYYKGSKIFIPPDLMFELREGNIVDFSFYSQSDIFMKPEHSRSGEHTRNGVISVFTNPNSRYHPQRNISIYSIYAIVTNYFKKK